MSHGWTPTAFAEAILDALERGPVKHALAKASGRRFPTLARSSQRVGARWAAVVRGGDRSREGTLVQRHQDARVTAVRWFAGFSFARSQFAPQVTAATIIALRRVNMAMTISRSGEQW